MWVIGVTYQSPDVDPIGLNKKVEMEDLGLPVKQVNTMHVYYIQSNATKEQIEKACKELLADPIIQDYTYQQDTNSLQLAETSSWLIEVKNKPGVTDAVGESTKKGLETLGLEVDQVHTAFTYSIEGQE